MAARLPCTCVSVCDLLGRELAVLVNEEKPAGIYKSTWDATKFPSGIYFCQMHAGNYMATKKTVLQR